MKKTLLAVTAVTLFFAACKKDDDKPGTLYLSKMIEIGEDGNDTTHVTYNADNTLKELYSSFINNGAVEFYAEGPVYQDGKITSILERRSSDPVAHTHYAFVYTGNTVTRINKYSPNQTSGQWEPSSFYDSLVYAGGKLTELYLLSGSDYSTKCVLAWEGSNVKSVSYYSKQTGGDYILYRVNKYTYDAKPAFQQLLTGNYLWLSDETNFSHLSANNVLKEEVFNGQDVLKSRSTSTYTFEGNLLKGVETKEEEMDPARTETYKTKLEYTAR